MARMLGASPNIPDDLLQEVEDAVRSLRPAVLYFDGTDLVAVVAEPGDAYPDWQALAKRAGDVL